MKDLTHEEMLEIAEQREKENEKLTKELLKQKLEVLKKENFQKVADACLKHYEEKYGELPSDDDYWVYMSSTYFATCEGHTTQLLISQALPGKEEDYENSINKYAASTSKQYRAVREFHEKFGTFSLHGLQFHSKEAFFEEYSQYIPPIVMRLKDEQCYKHFHTEVHFNYS